MENIRIPKERGSLQVSLSDKLRGGYYTHPEVAAWLSAWAIQSKTHRVLEPSIGDGVFLAAATERLLLLGTTKPQAATQVVGVEILPVEVEKAMARLRPILGKYLNGAVVAGDFFGWMRQHESERFDCAIGNPPFIRYQSFPEPSRSLAMTLMQEQGLRPNRLTNIWVPFIVACAALLKPGGRLGFVLPAELLQVTYAAQLRSFLANHFARIEVIACNHLFFQNAEQEVVLLLADGYHDRSVKTGTCTIDLIETENRQTLLDHEPMQAKKSRKIINHDSEKWLKYFLSAKEIAFMRSLKTSKAVVPLSFHATVDVGIVTGKNQFFVVAKDEIDRFGFGEFTIPLAARSSHLKGAIFSLEEWKFLAEQGERVNLLYLNGHNERTFGKRLKEYIKRGETLGIHAGYKCSIRKPWYIVPSMWVPKIFFFRQIYDFPRTVVNFAGATSTDTIHRMQCSCDPNVLASNLYSHLVAASAEIEGRSYGGGVLELEPTEAEAILTPKELHNGLPITVVDKMVRAGAIADVLEENDRLVLMNGVGLTKSECATLRGIWVKMRDRRKSRGRRK